jgi:hypothetical protein
MVTTVVGAAGGAAALTEAAAARAAAAKAAAASSGVRVTGGALKMLRQNFNTVKPKFWKREAATRPGAHSAENLVRMQEGKPPIGADGYPMELHHKIPIAEGGTNAFDNLRMMTRTEHRLGSNYKTNHPNLP